MENVHIDNEGNLIMTGKELLKSREILKPEDFKKHIYSFTNDMNIKTDYIIDQKYNDIKQEKFLFLKNTSTLALAITYDIKAGKELKTKNSIRFTTCIFYNYKDSIALYSDFFKEPVISDSLIFKVGAMMETSDDAIIIVSEKQKKEIIKNKVGNVTYMYYNYHFNDIKIDKEGNIIWTKTIFKRQITKDDDGIFGSYLYKYHNHNLYLIVNDNEENKTLIKIPDLLKICEIKIGMTQDEIIKEEKQKHGIIEKNLAINTTYEESTKSVPLVVLPKKYLGHQQKHC